MMLRKNTLIYALAAFVICTFLIFGTAYSVGADPLHPRSRHIWALTLVVAVYVAVRGALVLERAMTKPDGSVDPRASGKGLSVFKGKSYAIDRRMAARRERVAAARAKQAIKDDNGAGDAAEPDDLG